MQSGEDDVADEFEQCVCFCCVAYFPSKTRLVLTCSYVSDWLVEIHVL